MDVAPVVHNFLVRRPTATLGTLRRDGSPQASVVWFLWSNGEFVISTIDTTAKWHNLSRDPRASICVEDSSTGQMVVAYGAARLEKADVRARTKDLVAKYYDDDVGTDAHMDRIFRTDDRVLIMLDPTELVTRRLDE